MNQEAHMTDENTAGGGTAPRILLLYYSFTGQARKVLETAGEVFTVIIGWCAVSCTTSRTRDLPQPLVGLTTARRGAYCSEHCAS